MDDPKTKERKVTATISLPQAARKLGCSYATTYDYFLRGRLKGWKRGTRIAVTVRSVDALASELDNR